MTTVGSEISKLRNKLSNTPGFDDDSLLNDELLYRLLNDAGAIIFRRMKDKYYKLPEQMYSTFGVRLQEVNQDIYDCEDIPDRCKVLESTFKIPLPLVGRTKSTLRVYSGETELAEYNRANKYDNYLSDKLGYNIVNGKLRIYDTKVLKAITVKGIWHDIIQWEDYKYCPDIDEVICWDLNELEYPLYSNPEYSSMAHDIIIKSLGITIQSQEQNPSH